jgi:fermentation-respiration switch protein FrsA (DUF1100 family)
MWLGTATGPRPVDLILVVERKDGELVAQSAMPGFGSLGDDVADLRVTAGTLTAALPTMVGQMRIELALLDGALDGVLLATPPGIADPIRMPVRLERTVDARSAPGAKGWSAQLDASGQQLMIGLALAPIPGTDRWAGCVDIPSQGVAGLPCNVLRSDDGRVSVRIPVPGDPTLRLAPDGDGYRGTFTQGTFESPIAFVPHAPGTALPGPSRKARPQDPVPPFPYQEREVRIRVPSGHDLAGTYTVPGGASAANRVPGVVLLTGSGPQDRDESLMGHRPFAVLADALARRGIAVLRCDDRGVAASTGDFAASTIDDFASDASFMLLTLAAKDEVDPARVGMLGHSEGAATAALAIGLNEADLQAPARVSFLVMMAGTGVDGDAVLREQNARLMLAAGKSEAEIADARAAHAGLLDAVRQGADDAALREKARANIAEQLKLGGLDPAAAPPGAIDAQVEATVGQMRAKWMRRFLELDPAVALRKVPCPVLVLNGTLDTQVTPAQNVPAIEAALKQAGVPATVKILPGLNHLFQPAKTGAFSEYSQIETTMDPSVPAIVADWILAQPPRPPASR